MILLFHKFSLIFLERDLGSYGEAEKDLKEILMHEMKGTVFALAFEGMKHVKSEEGEMLSMPFLDVCKQIFCNETKLGMSRGIAEPKLTAMDAMINNGKQKESNGDLPTPAAPSVVTQFIRQLLIEQAGECLTDQKKVTDPVARLRMQSSALRSDALLQNLGSLLASTVNPQEASGREQSTTTDPAAASDGGVSNREADIRNLSQPRGGPDVPVVPIRISTLPLELTSSEPICSSVSVVYPVLARAQHADSSNVSGSHARMTHGHSFTTEIPSRLDQLLRNLFPAVNSQEAATVSDQDTLLSNLLHQIMSVVSQHISGGADGSSSVEENQDRGASSSRPDGPSSPPSPKRRKEVKLPRKGLKELDIKSFVEEVIVNRKLWSTGVQETMTGLHVFMCSYSSRDKSAYRTPLCKSKRGGLKDTYPNDILASVLKAVIEKIDLNPAKVGDIVFGSVLGSGSQGASECKMAASYTGFHETVKLFQLGPSTNNVPRKINAINKHNIACNEVPPTVGTKSVARRIHMKRKRGKEVTAIKGCKIAHYSKKKNAMINDKTNEIWRDLQNGEASSSCTPAEICIEKLGHIPGDIRGRPGSTKHVFETEILRMDLNSEKEKSKQLEKDHLELKENHLKIQKDHVSLTKNLNYLMKHFTACQSPESGSEDYDTEDYDDYVEAQDDV
uniref:3-ketoacyl-CoA thiolase 2, peroxisomal n=1 Tax=Tanacetum cinerariifolium TaxID=118510 RepID=A0A6L2LTL8_TANCI|nr:3-ketoacyl-CoA thiolase 2, peroxisomal [Tanacetum cinerariifolium]